MDFTLSKEHEMARKLFREFAQNEVKPLAAEIDEIRNICSRAATRTTCGSPTASGDE